jgi:hypothetical protein
MSLLCPPFAGTANLEYSISLYAGFFVASGLGVSPRQHSSGRFWLPARPSTLRTRDVVASPGQTPCAVIYPMP